MAGRSIARPLAWTATHAVLWGLLGVACVWIAPSVERRFASRGAEVSGVAIAIFRASHELSRSLIRAGLVLAVLLVIDFAILRTAPRESEAREWRDWWTASMAILPMFVLVGGATAVALSMLDVLFAS